MFFENERKNLVRQRRVYARLTQAELATKIGISPNLVRLYETNKVTIKYTYAKKMADLFGISINQLFE